MEIGTRTRAGDQAGSPPAGSLILANGLILPPDVIGAILRTADQIKFFGKFACVSRELRGAAVWRHLYNLRLLDIDTSDHGTVLSIANTLLRYSGSLANLRQVNVINMRIWEAFWPVIDKVKDQLTHVSVGFIWPRDNPTPTATSVPFSKRSLEHLSVSLPLFPWAIQCVSEGFPHLRSLSIEASNVDQATELLNALAATSAPIAKLTVLIPRMNEKDPMSSFVEASQRAFQALKPTLETVTLPLHSELLELLFGKPMRALDANFVPNFISLHNIHPNKLRFGPADASFWETYWRRLLAPGSHEEPDVGNIQAAFGSFHDSEPLNIRLARLFSTLYSVPAPQMIMWVCSKAQELQSVDYLDPLAVSALMQGYVSIVKLTHKLGSDSSSSDIRAKSFANLKSLSLREPGLLPVLLSCFSFRNFLSSPEALEGFLRDIQWCQQLGLDVNKPFLDGMSFSDALYREPGCLDALADHPGLDLTLRGKHAWPLNAFCTFILDQSPQRISAVHKLLRRYYESKSSHTAFKAAVKTLDDYSLLPLLQIEPICSDFVALFTSIDDAIESGIPRTILAALSPNVAALDAFFTAILTQTPPSGARLTPKQRNALIEEYVWIAAFKGPADRFGTAVGAIMTQYGRICEPVQDLMAARIQTLRGVDRVDVVRQIIKANAKSFSGSDRSVQALNKLRPKDDPTPSMDW